MCQRDLSLLLFPSLSFSTSVSINLSLSFFSLFYSLRPPNGRIHVLFFITQARDPRQSFFVNPFEESWKRNQGGGIMEKESTLGFPPWSSRCWQEEPGFIACSRRCWQAESEGVRTNVAASELMERRMSEPMGRRVSARMGRRCPN